MATTLLAAAVIDILALYTPLALERIGSEEALVAKIRDSIAVTNMVLANSEIPATVRLVGIERIEYVERPAPADFVADRDWVGRDGEVMALRNRFNADAVALFTEIPAGTFTTARGEALSLLKRNAGSLHAAVVASVNTLSGATLVVAHEIGHTLGGDHAITEPAAASRVAMLLTPAAHDYALPSKKVVTEMAGVGCSGCVRIPYFSSPDILYEGAPLGVPGQSDNAALFRMTAPVMAAYRNAYGPAGYVEFERDPFAVTVDEGTALVRVARHGGSAGAVRVAFRTIELPNEAAAGVDFVPVAGQLQWEDGDDSAKTIAVPILRGRTGFQEALLAVELFDAEGGLVLHHGSLAMVSILARERARAEGFLEFAAAELDAGTDGEATVVVHRTGGTAGPLSATVFALEGSAEHRRDFEFTAALVQWADGDSSPRSVSIPLHRTVFNGPPRTVKLRLNAPPSFTGRVSSAVLSIDSLPTQPRRRSTRH